MQFADFFFSGYTSLMISNLQGRGERCLVELDTPQNRSRLSASFIARKFRISWPVLNLLYWNKDHQIKQRSSVFFYQWMEEDSSLLQHTRRMKFAAWSPPPCLPSIDSFLMYLSHSPFQQACSMDMLLIVELALPLPPPQAQPQPPRHPALMMRMMMRRRMRKQVCFSFFLPTTPFLLTLSPSRINCVLNLPMPWEENYTHHFYHLYVSILYPTSSFVSDGHLSLLLHLPTRLISLPLIIRTFPSPTG